MKVHVDRRVLQRALAAAAAVLPSNPTAPILGSVLLEALHSGRLRVTAVGDLGLELEIPATVDQPGRVTAPAAKASAALKGMSGAVVSLADSERHRLVVTCDKSTLKLLTHDAAEYPPMPEADPIGRSMTLQLATIERVIAVVGPTVPHDDTSRYGLQGIHVHAIADGRARFVGTDGHSLGWLEADVGGDCQPPVGTLLPPRALTEAAKAMEGLPTVTVAWCDGAAIFTAERDGMPIRLTARLLHGDFPEYLQVIPRGELATEVAIDREALAVACRRVRVLATDTQKRPARVTIIPRDKTLLITGEHADVGLAEEQVQLVSSNTSKAATSGFNLELLARPLGCLHGPRVRLAFADALAPHRITSDDDPDVMYVVMPMRLDG